MIARPGLEGVQDRALGEVMDVLGAVNLARTPPARPPGHPVGEPVGKRIIGQAAILPRRDVLLTEPEIAHRLLGTARLHIWHAAPLPPASGH
jgi:hypothetical protein